MLERKGMSEEHEKKIIVLSFQFHTAVHLCGSDLESNGGFATLDLQEMLSVQLPENVTVVIQTGGAAVWQNEQMDASKLQRWLYNSEGLRLIEEQESANMGDSQTLQEFLTFADANYPADKVAVTFWNHGGGSVAGAAFDENYGFDSLNLEEMYQAFDAVWSADAQNPALELVGFDTCLMATIDVAAVFQNFSKYMVASEEVEPANGWLYSGWLGELAANPAMDGEELGIAICDTYYEGCVAAGTADQATLSVTDLTELTPLLEAYEAFGEEMFVAAANDAGFFAELGRAAAGSENYGGNTKEQGYTNMVDLGHLARQTGDSLSSAKGVSDALSACVIYQVGGSYRAEATGLSCYYSYNGDIEDLERYMSVGTGTAFKHLFAYELTGELGEGGEEYLAALGVQELPERMTLADTGWNGAELDVNDNGTAFLTLGPTAKDVLSGIGFSLFYVDEENDQMLLLGTDNDLTADWEKGVFYDNFRGVWGAIDGHLVYMELSFAGEDYNLYAVPILLNDEAYNLQVAYDFTEEEWFILGASQGLDESGMASKELRLLEAGDVITTIWKLASYNGDDDFEMYTAEEFTVKEDTIFGEAPLFDGSYTMVFEMWDAAGNYAYSDAVIFDCVDGEIITTVSKASEAVAPVIVGSNTGNTAGESTDNNIGNNAGSNTGGSTDNNTGNNAGSNTGESTDNNTGNNAGSNTGGSTDNNTGGTTGGSGDSSESGPASYYQVKFALGNGQNANISMPETAEYPADMAISALPAPTKAGTIFLGWYYDAAMTKGVQIGDTVNRNMTLYAKVAESESVTSLETPNCIVRNEVEAGTYTFEVLGVTDIASAIKFINVTGGNNEVAFTCSGSSVSAELEAGQTYQVELTNAAAQFKLADETEAQPSSVCYLNLMTAKETTTSASLNTDVKQIAIEETSGLDIEVFAGLYQIDTQGNSTENATSGTFTYTGGEILSAGDTVAVVSGDVNLEDMTSTAGDVAYIKIVGMTESAYIYEMAEVEDVLFIPDILPVESSWDMDQDPATITIAADHLSAAMLRVEADSLDAGDFIGFLNSEYNDSMTSADSYGRITGYVIDENGNCIISYDAASEADITAALDVYYTQEQEIELTEEEKNQIESDIKADVEESGYMEEAAMYLAALMLESDNLNEIPDMEDISLDMSTMQEKAVADDSGTVTRSRGGNRVEVGFDTSNIRVSVSPNSRLEHLNGRGFDVSVKIPFNVTIYGNDGNKIKIKITAAFEEEVILKQNVRTKRHRIGFLRYDYSLNASFEVGNYTGISFKADIVSADANDEALSEKLEEIMNQMEEYQNGTLSSTDGTMESLAEIYQRVMENANDAWIDIVNVKLFETNGNAFFHIFCYQIKGSFVVSANLCTSIGMNFDYTMQKQYNFSVRVKSKAVTNQTIDIIQPQYNFNFYVVGSIGVRAGLRLEMYVGLISLKLDKIGITADVGAYARLWGYFFYHLEWKQNSGKNINSAGAMLIESGIYLEIKFVAQVLNSNRLTWNPTLYAHEWSLWSAGEQQNIYAFRNTDDVNYTLKTTKMLALPGSTYDMKYMNLKDGKMAVLNRDDAEESSFIISFTDPAFSYDPKTNTVTVTPEAGSLEEETDMIITWKKAALAFTSKPIQKIIRISWSDPDGMRYISFDSTGGSAVTQISAGSGAAILWPEEPVKQGYSFAGWYTDSSCTEPYTGSTTIMPEFAENSTGMILYAKWTPSEVNYTVEHYLQELNGTYLLSDTEQKTGIVEEMTTAQPYPDIYAGFMAQEITQTTIAADGSSVVSVYYDRNTYTVTFEMNDGSDERILQNYLYEAELALPVVVRKNYIFKGWFTEETGGTEVSNGLCMTEDMTCYAQWEPKIANYTVSHWQQNVADDGYTEVTEDRETRTGQINALTVAEAGSYTGFTAKEVTQETIAADGTTEVKIYYDRELYVVAFKDDISDANDVRQIYRYGAEVTAPKPERIGYTLSGWYEKESSDKLWDFVQDTVSRNLTLYAKWNANQYTLTFDAGAGTLTEGTTKTVTFGETYGELPVPERTGYDFMGWYTQAEGGAQITKDMLVTAAENQTVYAQWKEGNVSYTVSHWQQNVTDDGYTEVTEDREIRTGLTNALTAAEAESYTGFTAKEIRQKIIVADGTTEVAIYYDRELYVVAFKDDILDANDVRQIYRYGAEVTAPKPERIGYTLSGWYEKESSDKLWDFAQDTVSRNLTLYAKWNANQYTLTFDAGAGTLTEGTTKTVTFGETYGELPVLERTGYDFMGWYTQAEGGAQITKDMVVTVAENQTVYAQWKEGNVSYTVSHWQQNVTDDGYTEVTEDRETLTGLTNALTAAEAESYTGFTAKEVTQEMIAAEGTTEVKIYYDRNCYQITWSVDEGVVLTGAYTQGAVRYGTQLVQPDTPEKAATAEYTYTFTGWQPEVREVVTEDAVYTAQFTQTANSYQIVYEGTENAQNSNAATYTYGIGLTLSEPEKTGYSFAGWYDGETPVTEISKTQTGDITLTAKWNANQYTLTFDAGAGTLTEDTTKTVTFGESYGELPVPERTGYDFMGWYTQAEGGVQITKDMLVTTAENQTVYAQWTRKYYAVAFMTDGGNEVESQRVAHGETAERPDDPEKTGHVFVNWYTEAECTNVYDFTAPVTSEVWLYAKYEVATYTITYELNGGSNAAENPGSYTYGEGVASFVNPTKEGYIFAGWRNGETLVTEISKTQTGDLTLTALWIEDTKEFDIWVAGTRVTTKNMGDILAGDTINTGKVSYDPATATLTLDNVNITSTSSIDNSRVYVGIVLKEAVAIELVGENTIDLSAVSSKWRMYNLSCDYAKEDDTLCMKGNGSLNLIAGPATNISACMSFKAHALVLDGCTVNLINTQNAEKIAGIYDWRMSEKTHTLMNGAVLKISGAEDNNMCGYIQNAQNIVRLKVGMSCAIELSASKSVGELYIVPETEATLYFGKNIDGTNVRETVLQAGKKEDVYSYKYCRMEVPLVEN